MSYKFCPSTPDRCDGCEYNLTGAIIAYEDGSLDYEEVVELFQHLVKTGMAWTLQGSYGRMAQRLIEEGEVTL